MVEQPRRVRLSRAKGWRMPENTVKVDRANLGALRGKNLACWCALDAACHADMLLEIANAPLPPASAEGSR